MTNSFLEQAIQEFKQKVLTLVITHPELSYQQIAEQCGCSVSFICTATAEAGIKRPLGRKRRRVSPQQVEAR